MDDDKEPKVWLTFIKLLIGAIIFIASVGFGLYYSAESDTNQAPAKPSEAWGIARDNPLKVNR